MKQQKVYATTQRFTQIEDIVSDLVLFSGNQAAQILEVNATNFALQSEDEQNARIYSYAALLNSLSFSIQILIVSRKLDISNYLKQLEAEASKTKSDALRGQINMYKDFVGQLVRANTVLDKKFYLVLYYSILEKGAKSVAQGKDKQKFFDEARTQLISKTISISNELLRVGLKSRVLEREELIKLFYEIYNPDSGVAHEGMTTTFVRGAKR